MLFDTHCLLKFQIECSSNRPQNSAPGRSDSHRGFPCSQEYTAIMIWLRLLCIYV